MGGVSGLRAMVIVVLAALAGPLASCAAVPAAPPTTFLRSVDLVEMTDRMAESFASTNPVSERDASDERWVISIHRIANHTNQIIRDSEKWLYVERMRGLLAQSDVGTQRNIVWVYPAEHWSTIAERTDYEQPPELRLEPTHRLTGTFHALTTTGAAGRTDTYHCSYELIDLDTGRVIWEDAFEVKRAVRGRTWD